MTAGMLDVVTERFIHFKASFNERINDQDSQHKLVLVIVCVALLLDNMLYMVIVPIIPITLKKLQEKELTKKYILESWQIDQLQNYTNITFNDAARRALENHLPLLSNYTREDERDLNVGFLFASKAIVELFISPVSGTITDRVGCKTPMVFGLSVIFTSTLLFAMAGSYSLLLLARSLQGTGSAFADTAGLAMIADRFKEEGARQKAQGIVLAFTIFGFLFAPPFGGFFYKYVGEAAPFLILSFIALGDGVLLLFVMKPVREEHEAEVDRPPGTPIYRLILDPYIAICAGALVMANVSLAFIELTLALWMGKKMPEVDEFQIGAVWLPSFIPHVLGVYVTVKLMKVFPQKQWLITAVGLVLEGVSCLILPFCGRYWVVMIPLMTDSFGIALVDTAMLPTLGYLMDIRHASVYGSVYAIADIANTLAYAFGPIVSDWCYHLIGFEGLNIGIFVSNIVYAPVLIFLKNVYKYKPFEEEEGEGGGPGLGGQGPPEITALRPGDQKIPTYMMSSIKHSKQDENIHQGEQTPSGRGEQIEQGGGKPNGSLVEIEVSRQCVQVGRVRSLDGYDENVGTASDSAREITVMHRNYQ